MYPKSGRKSWKISTTNLNWWVNAGLLNHQQYVAFLKDLLLAFDFGATSWKYLKASKLNYENSSLPLCSSAPPTNKKNAAFQNWSVAKSWWNEMPQEIV